MNKHYEECEFNVLYQYSIIFDRVNTNFYYFKIDIKQITKKINFLNMFVFDTILSVPSPMTL